MWRTLARDIEDAAVREIHHATQLVDDAHEGWLRAELAIAQVSQLATALEAAPAERFGRPQKSPTSTTWMLEFDR
jgi:hypothetical protein